MEKAWEGERRILGQRDLDELEILSSNLFSIGVPIGADPEFKALVFAAAGAHGLGNKWVDGHLKRVREHLVERFSKPGHSRQARVSRLLVEIRDSASGRISQLSHLPLKAESEGLRAAANSLIRLESTFRAASQLIRLRFAFESEAVIRLGYEQVAWANAAAGTAMSEEVEDLSSNYVANRLKPLLPDAGRIYGRLSNLAHMARSTHDRFVFLEGNSRTAVGIQLPEAALESVELLIELLDAFLVVSEFRFSRFGIGVESYDPDSGALLDDRPALGFMSELTAIRESPANSAAL